MKNFGQIQNTVISRAKIDPSDTSSVTNIMTDANDACSIVASLRDWDELIKEKTFNLTSSDGDIDYPLDNNVDTVGIVRITEPLQYARDLGFIDRHKLLQYVPAKTLNGTATPTAWYYDLPFISTDNLETKQISFDTMPDMSYTVDYTFKSYPPLITQPSNYPFFDQNYHYIIENYCLWKYAERQPDPTLDPSYFRGEWENGCSELLANYMSKLSGQAVIQGPNLFSSR